MTHGDDALYRALFDQSEIAIVVHDQASKIVHANQAFADTLGYTVQEALELSARDVIHHEDLPQRNTEADQLFAGHRRPGAVVHRRLLRKDGSVIRARVRKVVTDFHGEPVVMVLLEEWSTIAELEHDAHHDFLTGVRNRRGLHERLALNRSSSDLLLAMVDVDDLKSINDNFGHAAGDALLKAVASRLEEAAGPGAVVARWAGDEFVVCAPTADTDDRVAGMRLADALHEGIAAPVSLPRVPVMATPRISVGMTVYHPAQEALEDALQRADAVMYRQKRQ